MFEEKNSTNRGFSLIELIVTIAIASIVVIVVGTVMVSSATSYSAANTETSVQTRAQIVMNQIEDLVIDTRGGVDYGYKASGEGDFNWKQVKDPEGAVLSGKALRLYNVYAGKSKPHQICELEWKKGASDDKGELYYREYDSDDGDSPGASKEEIMSGGVSDFSCDLTEVSPNRILKVELTMTKGSLLRKRQYHVYKNISLRNPITVSGSSVTDENKVDLISFNGIITVEPGQSLSLYGAKANVISGSPSTEVRYRAKGSLPTGCVIEDGKTLKVSTTVDAESFYIEAYSVQEPEKNCDILVYVRKVKSVTIKGGNTIDVKPGDTVNIETHIDYQAEPGITRRYKRELTALKFTVPPAVGSVKTTGTTCSFKIPEDAMDGQIYTVKVSSEHADKCGYQINPEGERTVTINVIEPGSTVSRVLDAVIYRGQSVVDDGFLANPFALYSEVPVSDRRFLYRVSTPSTWGFTNDKATDAQLSAAGWKDLIYRDSREFGIPEPTSFYKDVAIDKGVSYQFAAVVYKDGVYRLCGRGDFRIPAFKLHINDVTDDSVDYKLFRLRGDNMLPRYDEDPIQIGQTERAFGEVKYNGTDKASGHEDSYYGNITVENTTEGKAVVKDDIVTSSGRHSLLFRVGKAVNTTDTDKKDFETHDYLEKADIKYPYYKNKVISANSLGINTVSSDTVSANAGRAYEQLYGLKNKYELHVSEVEYLGKTLDKYKDSDPYIKVETRIGNAVLQVRGDGYTDSDPVYDFRYVFIPVPDSSDDLLRYYNLQQLYSTYRPAGGMQGVYINTMKDGAAYKGQNKDTWYLIQMKVVDGVRYIRLWYPKDTGNRNTGETYKSADAAYFIGEYKYDKDSQMWKRVSTVPPSQI